MRPKSLLVVALAALAVGLTVAVASGADVNVGISIGVPAPPPPAFVVAAPPQLVLVPGTPVYQVPSASFNLFVFGGRYYSFHNNTWFLGPSHNGPWAVIAPDRVPAPVRGVPVRYYKIPPGQAKKMERMEKREQMERMEQMGGPPSGPPGQGKGHKGKRGGDD